MPTPTSLVNLCNDVLLVFLSLPVGCFRFIFRFERRCQCGILLLGCESMLLNHTREDISQELRQKKRNFHEGCILDKLLSEARDGIGQAQPD